MTQEVVLLKEGDRGMLGEEVSKYILARFFSF